MSEMTFSGWTLRQWAIVLAAFPRLVGTLDDAFDAQLEWRLHRGYEPGEELLPERPKADYEAAKKVLYLAHDALQHLLRPA